MKILLNYPKNLFNRKSKAKAFTGECVDISAKFNDQDLQGFTSIIADGINYLLIYDGRH